MGGLVRTQHVCTYIHTYIYIHMYVLHMYIHTYIHTYTYNIHIALANLSSQLAVAWTKIADGNKFKVRQHAYFFFNFFIQI
jgi:hypothetical protein